MPPREEENRPVQKNEHALPKPSSRHLLVWHNKPFVWQEIGKKNVLCYKVMQFSLEAHYPQWCTAKPRYCHYYISTILWNPLQQHPLSYHLQLLLFVFWTILIQATTKAARLELRATLQSNLNICIADILFSLNFLNILVNTFQKYPNALRGCCPENMRLSAHQTLCKATIFCQPRNTMP